MKSKRRPFLTFVTIVGALVGVTTWYIQSPFFAKLFKQIAAKYLPRDMGMEGNFSEFAVKLFPPGVSVRNPTLEVKKNNFLDLPPGLKIAAERIDLIFLPFQMFSGNVRVNEVVVVNGDVSVPLDTAAQAKRPARKKPQPGIHWDDLVHFKTDAVVVQNTRLHVKSETAGTDVDFLADYLRISQEISRSGPGYRLSMEIKDVNGRATKDIAIPQKIDRLRASGQVNALGVHFEEISLISEGVELASSGAIRGNVLEPKGLVLEANLNLKGDLEKAAAFLEAHSPKDKKKNKVLAKEEPRPAISGKAAFSGKVRCNLDTVMETLKIEGRVLGSHLAYGKWNADDLSADGRWSASPKGGEVAIARAEISSKEQNRVGGFQAGGGGKIIVGEFKYSLEAPKPFTVPIQLEKAHIHWLGAGALADVYPLNFRASGPAEITVSPAVGKSVPWNLQAMLGIRVDEFQLDNQRLGKTKPLHRVLNIPKLEIEGNVLVDPTGIRPAGLFLKLPKSKVAMSGKVDFKTGYDLYGSGTVHMEDFGEIAENKIRGDGTLSAHVHGLSSRVFLDFDADVKDAYYLNLNLGALKGRITWDDDPSHLVFTNCNLRRGRTTYIGNGMLDLGKGDTINLAFKVPQGDIYDFSQVFEHMTRDLSWYPRTLVGGVSGDFAVTGGIDLKELKVLAKLNGTNWEYAGERFKTVSLKGGYDRGKYLLSDATATKQGRALSGRISYDTDQVLDWSFHSYGLLLTDLDHIASLDVPLRGSLYISSTGKGKEGAIQSETQVRLNDLAVRGVPLPPSYANVVTENGNAKVTGSALGGQATLDLAYGFTPGTRSHIRMDMKRLDFSTILLLLNPSLMTDRSLNAFITGGADLSFVTGHAERMTGKLEVSEYTLAKSDTSFQLVKPVSAKVTDGTFDLRDLAIESKGAEAALNLQGRDGRIEGKIDGYIDLSLAEFASSSIAAASGKLKLDFALGGTITDPTIFGKALVQNGTVKIPAVETPFENINGPLQLRQNVISVQNLTSDLAGGRVNVEGNITVFPDKYPAIALKGSLSGNKLKIPPFQYAKVNGWLNVHGEEVPYTVDGSILVTSALWKDKVMTQKQTDTLKALRYTPPPTAISEGGVSKFKLNINVVAEHGIMIQNDLFDAEAKGKLTVVNTLDTPRLLGSSELIQGKILFKDRVFQIQSATAIFDNPTVINPKVSLTATTDVSHVRIQLLVSGALDKLKIELSSNPVMPESEILSLLALGLTSSEIKKISAGDRNLIEQSEAASLILHSLDFNREVKKQTGFEIQVDESVNTQTGTSVFRPVTQTGDAAATKIVVKRKIGKKIDFTGGSTVGGTQNEKEMTVEMHMTPNVSVQGVWDNYASPDTEGNRTSYGLDLKWEKRFK